MDFYCNFLPSRIWTCSLGVRIYGLHEFELLDFSLVEFRLMDFYCIVRVKNTYLYFDSGSVFVSAQYYSVVFSSGKNNTCYV